MRKIVVQIDADLLRPAGSGAVLSADEKLIANLVRHDLVDLYRYADEGPPPDAGALQVQGFPGTFEGWVTAVPCQEPDRWSASYSPDGIGSVLTGIFSDGAPIAESDTEAAYTEMDPIEARARRRRDWLAAAVAAEGLGADLYITRRPYLFVDSGAREQGTTVCEPREALGHLGLYFRTQGLHLASRNEPLDSDLYFFVASRELIPQGWRWVSACEQHSQLAPELGLRRLSHSLLQRVASALKARDGVHVAQNRWQAGAPGSSALFHLDAATLFLHGAVSVAARVAHHVLDLGKGEHNAGWQHDHWRAKVRETAPGLARLVEPGAEGGHIDALLRTFRNSIHGAALHGAKYQHGLRTENLIAIPPSDEETARGHMEVLGGMDAWGVKNLSGGRLYLDPSEFIERMLASTLALINDLLAETPVERLAGVSLSESDHLAPPDSGRRLGARPLDARIRQSVRWQLGF